ncbi:hypothetical protein QEH56_24370 [Pelagicoccus enzymogenes]|uniref:hypothetical protein n=1 Tax=Pelagicoccus enzymogenes TaxID=2773457 RepID=UPI00280C6B89|nr:hypothetical protein [Pelagicoccus enzymogenes]MDQ8201317.1 hypothetical protein [Pelagicoccus enzymogenes]
MELLGTVVFVITILFFSYGYYIFKKTKKNIPTKSTEELQSFLRSSTMTMNFHPTIAELKKRNEDYSMALPHLAIKAADGSTTERMIAWGAISNHFPEVAEEIEYDSRKPSKEAKTILRKLKI